jgi:hypothetical protein
VNVRLGALLAVALAAVIAVAGCGGSGADDATTASISKVAFIKKADAICTKVAEQSQSEYAAFVKANNVPEGEEPTATQWGDIGKTILIPDLQQQIDEIRQLGVPAGDEAEITAFLDATEKAIEKVEDEPLAAKSPSTLLANADKVSEGYGYKVCGGKGK